MSAESDATINAVAADVRREFDLRLVTARGQRTYRAMCEEIARLRLKDPADRAVIDRLAEQIASMEDIQRNMPNGLTETGRADLMTAYYIRDGVWRLVERRTAVGGSSQEAQS